MKIANNITALNTHRQYIKNNDKTSSSAEKLSSGYRINKAADDAAGLAISEKMRAQIRGLNQAKRNCQDGISLIQTAEGALQEVHSLLQRMNELAVQSATGTNEAFDRTQSAKEFEQLKREINDISEQTTFNNMKLLDGSLSYNGLVRSNYSSGIYSEFTGLKNELLPKEKMLVDGIMPLTNDEKPECITNVSLIKGINAAAQIIEPHISIEFKDLIINKDLSPGELSIQFTTGNPPKPTIISNKLSILAGASTKEIINAFLVEKDENGELLYNGSILPIYGSNNELFYFLPRGWNTDTSLKLVCIGNDKNNPVYFNNIDWGWNGPLDNNYLASIGASPTLQTPVPDGVVGNVGASTLNFNIWGYYPGTAAYSQFDFDTTKIKKNDYFNIGNQRFVFYDPADSHQNFEVGTHLININHITDVTSLVKIINQTQLDVNPIDKVRLDSDGNTIFVRYNGTAGLSHSYDNDGGSIMVDSRYGSGGNKYVEIRFGKPIPQPFIQTGTTIFTLDPSKMKTGDKITYIGEDGTIREHIFKKNDTAKDIMRTLGVYNIAEGDSWQIKSKTDQSYRLNLIPGEDNKEYAPIKIQVGALEGEQLAVKIAAMNTAGLKLDESNIYTQVNAGHAITSVRNAINIVSDQRASLGAMQNRLTHKISNLSTSVENNTASESRIRDIDIAQEIGEHTKSNILSQAATSMLAQANDAPQNVLSLLK